MQEEEARQAQRPDDAELLVETGLRVDAQRRAGRVAVLEARAAQLGQVAVGRRVLGAGIAVAEVRVE